MESLQSGGDVLVDSFGDVTGFGQCFAITTEYQFARKHKVVDSIRNGVVIVHAIKQRQHSTLHDVKRHGLMTHVRRPSVAIPRIEAGNRDSAWLI